MSETMKEVDEFFRTSDIESDPDLDDKLKDFEEKHLTESERKLINKSMEL